MICEMKQFFIGSVSKVANCRHRHSYLTPATISSFNSMIVTRMDTKRNEFFGKDTRIGFILDYGKFCKHRIKGNVIYENCQKLKS